MIYRDVLFQALDALDALDIPYMVVGSFASNFWGRPRATHDVDVVAGCVLPAAGDDSLLDVGIVLPPGQEAGPIRLLVVAL